jgi:hypothetical protein
MRNTRKEPAGCRKEPSPLWSSIFQRHSSAADESSLGQHSACGPTGSNETRWSSAAEGGFHEHDPSSRERGCVVCADCVNGRHSRCFVVFCLCVVFFCGYFCWVRALSKGKEEKKRNTETQRVTVTQKESSHVTARQRRRIGIEVNT